jgi:hypothetical protein
MAEQATSAERARGDSGSQEVSELHDELSRSREEVLRLRDLLIARDAELGAAKGRLAMIEQGSRRLADAAARIPVPGATRVLQGLIGMVQRLLR